MNTVLELLGVFALSYALSAGVIPAIRRLAIHRRLLDFPDGDRRVHRRPIPRLGGVAVFAGFVISLGLGEAWQSLHGRGDLASFAHTAQLLIACALLFAIGLADDLRGVPPWIKLVGQTVAALIAQYKWVLVSSIVLPPDVVVHLGWFGLVLGTLWLVGISNALNLVDGLDGIAAGVAIVALATSAIASRLLGGSEPIGTIALLGATVGFLQYNWPPAKIFLGDSGSLVIGFLLGFLTVRRATVTGIGTLGILPVFALAYPLLDTGLAMLRRWLRGHPLSRADGRHVHHQLRALGLDDQRAALVIYTFSTGVAALGLVVAFASPTVTVAATAAGMMLLVLVFVVGVRWLQYHEFSYAGAILRSGGSLARSAIRDSIHAHDVAALVKRAASLGEIDQILGTNARVFNFAHMHLGSANARLRLPSSQDDISYWKLEYPVLGPADRTLSTPGTADEALVLTVWCGKRTNGRAASAERVAKVVAEAIAAWSVTAPVHAHREIQLRTRTPPGAVAVGNPIAVSGGGD